MTGRRRNELSQSSRGQNVSRSVMPAILSSCWATIHLLRSNWLKRPGSEASRNHRCLQHSQGRFAFAPLTPACASFPAGVQQLSQANYDSVPLCCPASPESSGQRNPDWRHHNGSSRGFATGHLLLKRPFDPAVEDVH